MSKFKKCLIETYRHYEFFLFILLEKRISGDIDYLFGLHKKNDKIVHRMSLIEIFQNKI